MYHIFPLERLWFLFLLNVLGYLHICCASFFTPSDITPRLIISKVGRFEWGTVSLIPYSFPIIIIKVLTSTCGLYHEVFICKQNQWYVQPVCTSNVTLIFFLYTADQCKLTKYYNQNWTECPHRVSSVWAHWTPVGNAVIGWVGLWAPAVLNMYPNIHTLSQWLFTSFLRS